MGTLLLVLAAVCGLASLTGYIIIRIDAFQNEIWKGIVGLLCGLYLLYYALAEYDGEKKWSIVALWLVGGVAAGGLQVMAAAGH